MHLLRTLLVEAFEKRKQRNSSYSLRAFARDLGISPSRLSEILNCRARPKPETAQRLLQAIGASSESVQDVIEDIQSNSTIDSSSLAKESYVVTIDTLADCKKLLKAASRQSKQNSRYVYVSIDSCIPLGLDHIVREHKERN